jgi:hypothetical protein
VLATFSPHAGRTKLAFLDFMRPRRYIRAENIGRTGI